MKVKNFLRVSVGLKICFVILGILLVRVHFVTGQSGTILLDRNQSISAVRAALNSGADVNFRNKDGFTPLMLAVERGNLDRAQLLLNSGANIHLKSYTTQDTALHLAAASADDPGSRAMVPVLLRAGANTHAVNSNLETPLHKSLNIENYENRLPVFAMLIKYGADINAQNNKGYTPLHIAIEMRDRQGIEQLLNAFGQLFDMNKKTKTGKTPLAFAQESGNTEIMQLLSNSRPAFGLKGNVNGYNNVGLNGLHLAVLGNDQKLVTRLLVRGADINFRTNDEFDLTPLQLAIVQKNLSMMELLLKNNPDLSVQNKDGDTAVHSIARVDDFDFQKKAYQLLDKYNANFNLRGKNGGTILHLLVRSNDKQLLGYLVNTFAKKLNPSIENLDYETPVYLARKLGRNGLIPELEKLR